jgi:hypothetical protein
MPPPNDYYLAHDVWIRRLADGNLDLSKALEGLLAESRTNYDWPAGTGPSKSQRVIIDLEREVETSLKELDLERGHQIIRKVSEWGGNRSNAQRKIEGASRDEQVRMRDAIRRVLNPSTLKVGLDDLSCLPGLSLVMATKIFRFCCPSKGAAVDRHASYFLNSLNIIWPNGTSDKSTHFKRQWAEKREKRNVSSRLANYSSNGRRLNRDEFVDVYLPLLAQIAESLNRLGVTYRCAVTALNKNWRPADVEMAVYYWGSRNGSR